MLTNQLETEIADLRAIAEERGRFLEITSTALHRLSGEADRRKAVADDLQRIAEERQAVIEELQAELERAVGAAEERLAVIERLAGNLERHSAEAEARIGTALADSEKRMAQLQSAAD